MRSTKGKCFWGSVSSSASQQVWAQPLQCLPCPFALRPAQEEAPGEEEIEAGKVRLVVFWGEWVRGLEPQKSFGSLGNEYTSKARGDGWWPLFLERRPRPSTDCLCRAWRPWRAWDSAEVTKDHLNFLTEQVSEG